LNTLQTSTSHETVRCDYDADCQGNNNTYVIPVTPSIYGQRVRIFAEKEGKEYITSIYEGYLRDELDSGKFNLVFICLFIYLNST
jgi:hypothetical protein